MGYPSMFTVDRVLAGEEIDLGGVSYKVNGVFWWEWDCNGKQLKRMGYVRA